MNYENSMVTPTVAPPEPTGVDYYCRRCKCLIFDISEEPAVTIYVRRSGRLQNDLYCTPECWAEALYVEAKQMEAHRNLLRFTASLNLIVNADLPKELLEAFDLDQEVEELRKKALELHQRLCLDTNWAGEAINAGDACAESLGRAE